MSSSRNEIPIKSMNKLLKNVMFVLINTVNILYEIYKRVSQVIHISRGKVTAKVTKLTLTLMVINYIGTIIYCIVICQKNSVYLILLFL